MPEFNEKIPRVQPAMSERQANKSKDKMTFSMVIRTQLPDVPPFLFISASVIANMMGLQVEPLTADLAVRETPVYFFFH